jgi:mono/diheme cytochrome c family protein
MLILAVLTACSTNPYKQGQVLYEFHCGGCHMDDGSGLEKLIPPLDTQSVYFEDPGKLVCLVLEGLPPNEHTRQQMPPNKELSETEMTNLVNYLGFRFRGRDQWVKFNEIEVLQASCHTPGTPQ